MALLCIIQQLSCEKKHGENVCIISFCLLLSFVLWPSQSILNEHINPISKRVHYSKHQNHKVQVNIGFRCFHLHAKRLLGRIGRSTLKRAKFNLCEQQMGDGMNQHCRETTKQEIQWYQDDNWFATLLNLCVTTVWWSGPLLFSNTSQLWTEANGNPWNSRCN